MKKFLTFILTIFTVTAFSFSANAENNTSTQTHTVENWETKYEQYSQQYFSGYGTPLDGVHDKKNMIIPGLLKNEKFIPQGIGYYENGNQVIISSYDTDNTRGSMIYTLDFDTGEMVGAYKIRYNNGDFVGHVGGIAVSGENVYIANGRYIYYLSMENVRDGIATITDRKQIAGKFDNYNETGNCSFISVTDGVLWVGNFYKDSDGYRTYANDDFNSVVYGFNLTGDKDEWKEFKGRTEPDFYYFLEKGLDEVQGATVKNSNLILSCSFGRKNDSRIRVVDTAKIKNHIITPEDVRTFKAIPMSEGLFVKDDSLYIINESGAFKYSGDISRCPRPTDVVWKYDLKKIEDVKASVYIPNDVEVRYKGKASLGEMINSETDCKVEYISSDTSIVKVDANGNLTGTNKWLQKTATVTCKVTDANGNSTYDTCCVTAGFMWWQWVIGILFAGWIWY